MDFGAFSTYTPPLTGEFWATSASLATAVAAWILRARRIAATRRVSSPPLPTPVSPVPVSSPKPAPIADAAPLLSGVYRGRSVEMSCGPEGLLCASVGLLSLLPPESPWLAAGPILRARLAALPRPVLLCAVSGFLHLAAPQTASGPQLSRVLLDLACDLADAVEGLPPAAPLPMVNTFATAKNRPC